MNGLAISGGGGAIGYLAGAVRVLSERYTYEKIVGVSSGALTGIMLSIGRIDRLIEKLSEITDREVVRKRPLRFGISTLFGGSMGYYSNRPLRRLLREELLGYETLIDFSCVAVNARTGRPIWWQIPKKTEFTENTVDAWVSQILSSTAIPVAFSPIKIGNEYYTDGGSDTHVPIEPLKALLPDAKHISIVSTAANEREETGISIIQIAGGMTGDLISSVSERDFLKFEFKNRLALQGDPEYRYYDNIIIRPEQELAPTTRFHYKYMNPDIEHGAEMALKQLRK